MRLLEYGRGARLAVVTMHQDELVVTPALVSELIASQFPDWAQLRVERVSGPGTVNAIFRIGETLTARFPLREDDAQSSVTAMELEAAAAAEFAERAKIASPEPVGVGRPGAGYPMPWLVQTWVPGLTATPRTADNGQALASDIALLLGQLRSTDVGGRRFSGRGRGGDLKAHDAWIARCLTESEGMFDTERARTLWTRFRDLPASTELAMSHTDLIPANLLVRDGRLAGVLDTGGFAPADPALDLVVAWHLFDAEPREVLRRRLVSSSVEWARGAAWAFHQAMGLVWYYESSNPTMSELGRSTLDRIFEANFDGVP